MKTISSRRVGLLALLAAGCLMAAEPNAHARAGGGISSGSRGSRSYSSPTRPYASPAPSSRQPSAQPRPLTPLPAPAPAPVSPFWRGLAGGMLGGFLGGMLFRGFAGAGGYGGMGGGGIGLLDILILAAIGYGIYWWVRKRREEEMVPAEGSAERPAGLGYYGPELAGGSTATQEPLFEGGDLQAGLGHIRQMDARFEEAAFRDLCEDNFFKIQAGWMNRDVGVFADLLTSEMQNEFRKQLDDLKQRGRINRLENIAVRSVEITEAWQESGQDYIAVHFLANLLDYTVDEGSGQVVEGSKTQPVKFEEYWTWTRPVGPNPWRLSAIIQPN